MDRTKPKLLDLLAEELLVQILSELDGESMMNARATNRRLKNAMSTQERLHCSLELYMAGMDYGHRSLTLPAKDLRRLLHAYQRSWITFSKVAEHDVSQSYGRVRELAGDILAQQSGDGRIFVYQLPSLIREPDCLTNWTLFQFDHRFSTFAVDASQNLLVTMHVPTTVQAEQAVVELRPLTLHSGAPHGQAAKRNFEHTYGVSPGGMPYLLQWNHALKICENLLCVHHTYASEEESLDTLVIWDWKTGDLIMKLNNCGIESFAFLTPNLIMFSMGKSVVRQPHVGDDAPRLLVCDITETSRIQKTKPNSFMDVCEFHFPVLRSGAKILKTEIRSDPPPSAFPNGNVHYSRFSKQIGVPFSVAPENRTFVVTISALADHDVNLGRMVAFRLFVPLSTFMHHVEESTSSIIDVVAPGEDGDNLPDTLPRRKIAKEWSQWGPNGSRAFSFMSPELDQNTASYVYGSRFATRYPPANTSATQVQLLDFNQASLRKYAEPASVEDLDTFIAPCPCEKIRYRFLPKTSTAVSKSHTRIVTEPSILYADSMGVFMDDLETRLPYRETMLTLTIEVCAVMISEDCLVLERSRQRSYYVLSI